MGARAAKGKDGGRRTEDGGLKQRPLIWSALSNVTLINEMALSNWTIMTGEGYVFWGISTYSILSDAGFTLFIQVDSNVAMQRLDLSTRIVDMSG